MADHPDPKINDIELPTPQEEISQSELETLADYAKMLKDLRSWGFWSLGLGLMHLIGSGFLSAPWGLISLYGLSLIAMFGF